VSEFFQLLILGLLQGGTYGLLAAGLALIIGVMNILNVAHGEFMVLPALCVWIIWAATGINPFVILIPVALATLVVGAATERLLIERVIGQPVAMGLLMTFGLSLLMRSTGGFVFSLSYREIPILQGSAQLGNVILPEAQVAAFIGGVGVYLLIFLMLRRTQFGRAIRACAQNPEAALACGIDARSVRTWAFGIGCMMAATAGGFLILYFPLNAESGFQLVIAGVVAQMIGGVTRFVGAFFGGLALGEIQVVGGFYVSSEWAQVFVFATLLVVFLYRGTRGARELLR
jgi:branched-chain amino acid transport system permease protein